MRDDRHGDELEPPHPFTYTSRVHASTPLKVHSSPRSTTLLLSLRLGCDAAPSTPAPESTYKGATLSKWIARCTQGDLTDRLEAIETLRVFGKDRDTVLPVLDDIVRKDASIPARVTAIEIRYTLTKDLPQFRDALRTIIATPNTSDAEREKSRALGWLPKDERPAMLRHLDAAIDAAKSANRDADSQALHQWRNELRVPVAP
jgi:hypothetical protein